MSANETLRFEVAWDVKVDWHPGAASCVRTPSQAYRGSSAFAVGQIKRQVTPEGP
jgi:hypothetical protein